MFGSIMAAALLLPALSLGGTTLVTAGEVVSTTQDTPWGP